MGSLYQPTPQQEERNWRPVAVAVVVVLIVGLGIWLFARNQSKGADAPTIDLYAENLVITDLHMATAENFVGGSVTYVEGKINNVGPKTVTGLTVQTVFRNAMGEVVDQPIQPMRVQTQTLQGSDFVGVSSSPITPNAARDFRLTFEHISADWNQGMPELRIIQTQTK